MNYENSERFLNAFVNLEQSLNKKSPNYRGGFTQKVHFLSRREPLIKRYKYRLIEFAQLRNAIVHERQNYVEVIAEPHDNIVEEIEHIAKLINEPPKIKNLKLRKAYTCRLEDNILELSKVQSRNNYSIVPCFNKNGDFVTCVHSSFYMEVFSSDKLTENMTVKAFLDALSIRVHIEQFDENDYIHDVIESFEKGQRDGQSLKAALILKKGKVLNVLTQADLPKLLNCLNNYK